MNLFLMGEGCLDFVTMKFHELASIYRHLAEDDCHLLWGEESTGLELICEGGEDVGIHGSEAHAIVVLHARLCLFILCLVPVDGKQCSLRPLGVCTQFDLEESKGFGLGDGSGGSDHGKHTNLDSFLLQEQNSIYLIFFTPLN